MKKSTNQGEIQESAAFEASKKKEKVCFKKMA